MRSYRVICIKRDAQDSDRITHIGVGVPDFSVGVEGTLHVMELSLPVSESINVTNAGYTCSANLDVSALSGELDLYAKAGPFEA